ncbi:peptidase M23 [Flavobacterium amnicola]|uniref:Peptidase M23 n=1 Tax=Flavobacterium amnicola TaxID=2506422 RepID=A0A4Q1K526_9FLAO|nr:peptidoglycan DD-metalloendopeptidase family protein [Flavobacterium amnicola]RXR20687.1 peptidase M23 [Flavobacterium amnicola]
MDELLTILQETKAAKVISNAIEYSDYVPLDLSINNVELASSGINTANEYAIYIQNHLNFHKGKIAYGGYLENRNLYKRSAVFHSEETEERNIHIGLDLWINETAPIYAALEGKIHSFQNNTALGDYGPTIILEHKIASVTFYTLYGHLSLDSLENKKVGQLIKKGEQIANLGMPPINGDYAPHLHFQVIVDLENKTGDYPGVCSLSTLSFYEKNCPDPNLLLKIKK